MNGSYKFLKSSYKVLVPYTISSWVHKLEMWNLVSHRILPLSPSWRRWSWYCWSSGDALRTCTHTSRDSPPSEGSRWPLPSVSRCRMSSPSSLGTWRSVSQWEGIVTRTVWFVFSQCSPFTKTFCVTLYKVSDLLSRCSLCINFCDATFLFSVIIYIKVHSICWLH